MNAPFKRLLLCLAFVFNGGFAFGGQNSGVTDNMPKHHIANGFQNYPYVETAAPKGLFFYLRRFWGSVVLPDIPDGHVISEEMSLRLLESYEDSRITWLGHASFLITVSKVTILTDPFLTEFASPISWAGPRRFVESSIPIEKLPPIDVILLSHNHYDHLDERTIRRIANKERIHVVVPLGVGLLFRENGYTNVTELDWGESVEVRNTVFTSHSAVHDSARATDDHNKTLWSSWSIVSDEKRVFFIGDSGYSNSIYKEVGEQYGSFDYAVLPIGAYEPRKLMWMSHFTPEEAVKVGKELRAKNLIASHWGTVSSLSDELMWEPPKRFFNEGLSLGYGEDTLWIMKIGETRPMIFTDSGD
ncbi:MAG: MBL fold metallo-hydrolase [Gammaproteobacteria bacterium]|nr:MBL fold metallo-hydrolase [Gammaproteobacteria bacterium]